jgi:type III secretion protein D
MDRDPLLLETLQALELRVLEGPQAGARAPLAAGTAFVIAAAASAHAADADIVLRDSPAPVRVRVSANLGHALIEVLDGELCLGDQVLAAGAQAAWARHAPMRIGGAVVAFGLACEDEWPLGTARAAAGAPAAAADAPRPPLRRRAEAWLAATGAGVLLACAGSLWMAHVAAAPRPMPVLSASTLVDALKASEFAALEAATQPDGRLVVRGRLSDLAQRGRLEAWLARHQWTPSLDLLVDEAIAREVTEVFRVNGIAGQLKAAQGGRFAIEVAERDVDRLARAEDVVRRDVRGLVQLTVRNTATPLPPPTPPVVDDPNKRIASLVPGDLPYVVTVDGARYFVGALLPSGHRIAQIAAQRVVLERDGRETNLNF